MTKTINGNDVDLVLGFINDRLVGSDRVPPAISKQAEYVLENVEVYKMSENGAANGGKKETKRNEERFSKEKNHSKKKRLTKEGKKSKEKPEQGSLRSPYSSSLRSSNIGKNPKNVTTAKLAKLQEERSKPLIKQDKGYIAIQGDGVPTLQGNQAIKHCVSLLPEDIYERLDNPFGLIGRVYKAYGFRNTRQAVLTMNTDDLWGEAFRKNPYGYLMNVAKNEEGSA